jgi:tetratricopeptide (TPR) repeat protein
VKAQAALNNADAKIRFAAVKKLARDKDVTALKKLAELAANDPDEQVREVAAKAIQYIKADSRAEAEAKLEAKTREPEISARDQARAKAFLDAAIGYYINGERERALKELSKAISVNPKLERDPFFKNTVEDVTGAQGEEALNMVRNSNQLKEVAVTERKLKQEKRQAEHLKDVQRSRWSSVLMDLAIYTFLSIVLTALGLGLSGQSAQGYINNQIYLQQAFEAGERDAPPEVDPAFDEYARQVAAVLTIPLSVTTGVVVGLLSVVSLLINLLFTHLAAKFIFRGQATFPHLIYKVVSLYNTRLPVFYVILFVGIVLGFAMGSSVVAGIAGAILSLYSLMLFLGTIGRIGETYDFGSAKGCLSLIVGSFILSVIGFVVHLLFLGSILAVIQSQTGVNLAG